jgi:hypothetical protein
MVTVKICRDFMNGVRVDCLDTRLVGVVCEAASQYPRLDQYHLAHWPATKGMEVFRIARMVARNVQGF